MINALEAQREIVRLAIDFDGLINDAMVLVFETLRDEVCADRFAGLLGEELDVGGRIILLFGELADAGGGGDRAGDSVFSEAFGGGFFAELGIRRASNFASSSELGS